NFFSPASVARLNCPSGQVGKTPRADQLHATTPTVEQTQAFHQMLAAAQTDEDAAVAARKIFENADAHLSLTRTAAAGALANLTPASVATVASTTASTTVDLSGAKQMQ